MYPSYDSSANPTSFLGSFPLRPSSSHLSIKSEAEVSARSSFTNLHRCEQLMLYAEQPSVNGGKPHVNTLARRIHGWSWQGVRLHSSVSGIVISSFVPLIVPHRHGHWCRLCHSVGSEGASWAAHKRRDGFFLHKPFALYPQFLDTPSASIMCGPCTSGSVPYLTIEHRSISTAVQTITQRSSQGRLCSPHSKNHHTLQRTTGPNAVQ